MARGAAVHRPIVSIVPLALIASLAIATALAYGFAMHFTPGAGLSGWMLLEAHDRPPEARVEALRAQHAYFEGLAAIRVPRKSN